MNNKKLLATFNQAINWNAFLYVIQKGLFFTTSLLLYKNLSAEGFSLWANINCSIFLFLLWIDFGFRKSIPRYAPEFGSQKKGIKNFIRALISFQLFALTVTTPIFFFLSRFFAQKLALGAGESIFYFGCALFFVEGMVCITRLVLHSYFLQKQFNLFASVVLMVQTVFILLLVCYYNGAGLLPMLFFIKIVSGLAILIGGLVMFFSLRKKMDRMVEKESSWQEKRWEFIKHSGFMWGTTSLKSLTERNFLVPLFTFVLGPQQANLFKLANDAALFFQRVAIKTIGTTDTSLFAHAQMERGFLPGAFRALTTKLLTLCIPLLGISLLIFFSGYHLQGDQYISKLFFVLTVCYLLHVLLSPYERVLEVKRRYRTLLVVYIPYFLLIALLLFCPKAGLFGSIVLIHGVRLVSVSIAALLARAQFGVRFFGRS